ncbi:MAG: ATP-binding protein [Verrucomicrobiota bacterium]|jgi:signal transduction histidine kinase
MHSSRGIFGLRSLSLGRFMARQLCTPQNGAGAILLCLLCLVPAPLVNAAGSDAGGSNTNLAALASEDNPTNGLGSWIWTAKTFDRQTCQFWRSIEIPSSSAVTHAQLRMTVDNEYTLFLDGRELGRGAEWRELFDYNVTPLMAPGPHTLAVKAYNSSDSAGMLFGLRIDLADGRTMEIKSDRNWRIVPDGATGWEKADKAPDSWPCATIIAPLGGPPWSITPQRVNPMPTLQPIRIHFWQTGWFQISLLSVCVLATLISARLITQLAAHRKERWLLQRERARIARDIHDDLGSRMTQVVLHGEVAQSELPADSPTCLQLDRMCEEARGVLSAMDEILWAVNPKRDTFRDFTSYVCGYAQEFLKPTSIQCLFDVDPEMSAEVLDLPARRSLLMAIKETLHNAVKHSEASELVLQIRWRADRLVVAVSDNGKGFDQTKSKPDRNGFANMAQRVHEVGGTCLVTSQPGKGCRVEFGLPLKPSRWRPWHWLRKPARLSEPVIKTKPV